jgi:hypothetical protein
MKEGSDENTVPQNADTMLPKELGYSFGGISNPD